MFLAVLIISLLLFFACKMPIALAMLFSSVLSLLVTGDIPMMVIPQKLWGGLESFPLLAIPMFVFAGILMNKGGGAERIFDFCLRIVGHVRGGLAHVNVLASVIFAGMSGAATADAAGLGAIEIEAMKRDGYSPEFSAAVTAASSTIGPIIPPSVPLVVYGVMTQVSIGSLFIAGIIPGLIMALCMMGIIAYLGPRYGFPTRPKSSLKEIVNSFFSSLLALLAPVIILGGIFTGIFTPTEAGVVAAVYALFLGFVYGGIKLKDLIPLIQEAMLSTAQITFIVGAASLFAWIITRYQVPAIISDGILTITSNKYIVLLLINAILIFLGCFIDALALVIMMTPVIVPIATAFQMDLVQIGVLIVLNTMIALITPPVGLCLYIASDVAEAPILRVTKTMMPFYLALFVSLMLVTFIPALTTFLPKLINL